MYNEFLLTEKNKIFLWFKFIIRIFCLICNNGNIHFPYHYTQIFLQSKHKAACYGLKMFYNIEILCKLKSFIFIQLNRTYSPFIFLSQHITSICLHSLPHAFGCVYTLTKYTKHSSKQSV